jgi:hypothetical protein
VSAVDDGLWTAFSVESDTTALYHHTAELVATVSETFADVAVGGLEPTPDGGVVIVGTYEGEPVVVGVDAQGVELWRGGTRQIAYPRVEADGPIRLFDGIGPAAWEHDPRAEPAEHFPLDQGIVSAWLLPDGAVSTTPALR